MESETVLLVEVVHVGFDSGVPAQGFVKTGDTFPSTLSIGQPTRNGRGPSTTEGPRGPHTSRPLR